MSSVIRTARSIVILAGAAAVFVITVHAQSPGVAPSEANHFIETPRGWVHPKTAWGDPDLTGTWPISFVGSVPLERCSGGGRAGAAPCDPTKAFLTDAEYRERVAAATQAPDRHAAAIAAGNFGQALQSGIVDPTF